MSAKPARKQQRLESTEKDTIREQWKFNSDSKGGRKCEKKSNEQAKHQKVTRWQIYE